VNFWTRLLISARKASQDFGGGCDEFLGQFWGGVLEPNWRKPPSPWTGDPPITLSSFMSFSAVSWLLAWSHTPPWLSWLIGFPFAFFAVLEIKPIHKCSTTELYSRPPTDFFHVVNAIVSLIYLCIT
jgi:hypothetical protein